ncbi:MAG: cysteine protease [Mucilaginibacter sp.]|nr:cysteine protease [Mucilaginibacter sp.]
MLLLLAASHVKAQRIYPYGGINDVKLLKATKIALPPSGKAAFPSAYSLKKYAPIAGDQYPYGECVPWALCYSALTIAESVRMQREDSTATTKAAFSPSFIYEQIKAKTDTNCADGSVMVSGLDIMKNIGSVRQTDFTYACGKTVDTKSIIQASSFKIKDYEQLTDSSGKLIESIKAAISSGNPVSFFMVVTPSFDQLFGKEYWTISEQDLAQKDDFIKNGNPKHIRIGWHGMCITGYDDTDQGGVLEILNSWSTGFGLRGYIKIKYTDFLKLYGGCFVMHLDDWEISKTFTFKAGVKILQSTGAGTPSSHEFTPKWFGPDDLQNSKISDFGNELLRVDTTFKELDQFRLLLKGNLPTYVYIVNYNSDTHEIDTLFPYNTISPFINSRNFLATIPSEDIPITINGASSSEFLTILYSQKQLSESDLLIKLKAPGHTYFENLESALSDRIIDFKSAQFDKTDGTFTVTMDGNKYILPIVVTIRH